MRKKKTIITDGWEQTVSLEVKTGIFAIFDGCSGGCATVFLIFLALGIAKLVIEFIAEYKWQLGGLIVIVIGVATTAFGLFLYRSRK